MTAFAATALLLVRLLFSLLLVFFVPESSASVNRTEVAALRQLYRACDGEKWLDVQGWPLGEPCVCIGGNSSMQREPGLWTGVVCDERCDRIVAL